MTLSRYSVHLRILLKGKKIQVITIIALLGGRQGDKETRRQGDKERGRIWDKALELQYIKD